MKTLTVKDLARQFDLTVVQGDDAALSRPLHVIEVDRPGLEMTGFFEYHQRSRLVVLGNKEFAYLKTMTPEQIYSAFVQICSEETPGLVVCHGRGDSVPEEIKKAASRKDCPILSTEEDTAVFEADVLNWLSEKLAPHTSIHANLMEIFGAGTLIMGDSGIGKSEIALDLIKKGHILVSDDKVEIRNVRGRLEGSSPDITYGMMEVRGIGLINVPRMFGINSIKRKSHIRYCIDLRQFDPADPIVDRTGQKNETIDYLGVKIPYARLLVSSGRSMFELIEVAVTNFKLKESGYDSLAEFEKVMDEARQKKAKEMEGRE